MSSAGVILGSSVGPFEASFGVDFVRAYAGVTHDPSPLARAGEAVPPVAIATQSWMAQNTARTTLIPEYLQQSGVHGEHDIVLHRPIAPGEVLHTWVEGHGARPSGRNSIVILRYVTKDADDVVVAEQWWTTVFLGNTCTPAGAPAPAHRLSDDVRSRRIGRYSVLVDDRMPHRYAELSGDWSPHHFDADAARQSGFDRPFLHGLCTMALCAQGVVALVANGDPSRVRRVAVRFANPMPVGEELRVDIFDSGGGASAFEAGWADAAVITNGLIELR